MAATINGKVFQEANVVPLGYQQITDLAASTALTVPATASIALIQAEAGDARWRDDGVAPTAAVGMLLFDGAELMYNGDLSAVRLIKVTAGTKVNISYWGNV